MSSRTEKIGLKIKGIVVIFIASVLPALSAAHDKRYQGHFTFGHEVSTFKPCNGEKVFWLNGSGHLLHETQQLAMSAHEKPYTPIYLEFRGHEHFEAVDGFQAEYENQLHLSEIYKVSVSIPSACK